MFVANEFALISSTGFGVLQFELAWTPDTINEIFTAWGVKEMETQAFMIYLDFLYIPIYGLFEGEIILLVSRKVKGKLEDIGLMMSITGFIAGIFDAIENINLLLMLGDAQFITAGCPFYASLCAMFKISFLVLALCFVYVIVITLILRGLNLSISSFFLVLFGGAIFIFWLLSLWNLFLSVLIGCIFLGMLILIRNPIKICFLETKKDIK